MITDGFIIMAIGMLVVFVFLAIMVMSMRTMSGFVLNFFPEKIADDHRLDNAEIAVAIAMAYTKNRPEN